MTPWRAALLLALLLIAGGLSLAAIEWGGGRNNPSERGQSSPGQTSLGRLVRLSPPQPAPAVGFTDLSGRTVSLQDFAGKAVLVNLWATWCGPCRREMPSLERLQQKLGDRIAILAISEDIGGAKTVEPFFAKLALTRVKPYLDPKSAVGQAFKVDGLPTSFLLDRQGKVQGRVEGEAEWDSPRMLAVITPMLAQRDLVKIASPREPR